MATDIWQNGNGDWGDPNHWSLGVPTNLDHAVIQTPGALVGIASTEQFSAASLTLKDSGGELDIEGKLTLSNGLVVNGGSIAGGGTLTLTGGSISDKSGTISVANLVMQNTVGLLTNVDYRGNFTGGTVALNGHNLTLNGGSHWEGGTLAGTGSLRIRSGPVVTVDHGLLLDGATKLTNTGFLGVSGTGFIKVGDVSGSTAQILNEGTIFLDGDVGIADGSGGSGTTSFINSGSLEKAQGTGTSSVDVSISGSGRIEASSGTLLFDGVNNLFQGPIYAKTGAAIVFAGASSTFSGFFVGKGTVSFTNGINSLASVTHLDVARINIGNGSAVTVRLGTDLSYFGSLTQSSGTIDLNGHSLTLSGSSFLKFGAVVGGGNLVVSSSGTVDLGTVGSSLTLGGSTVLQNGGSLTIDDLVLGDNGSSHASVVSQGKVYLEGGVSNGAGTENVTFSSSGTLVASAAHSSRVSIGVDFSSTGKVTVDHGATLALSGTQNSFGGTIAGGGILEFVSGTQTFQSGLAVSVAHIKIDSGTVSLLGDQTIASQVTQLAGQIDPNGHTLTLDLSASLVGTLSGQGTLVCNGATTLGATGSTYTIGGSCSLDLNGATTLYTCHVGDGGGSSASCEIGGMCTMMGDITDGSQGTGPTSLIVNVGLIDTTGNPLTVYVKTVDNGVIDVNGGHLTFTTAVTGTGLEMISNGTLTLDTQDGNYAPGGGGMVVEFGSGGNLVLANAALFNASLTGFGSTDTMDLESIIYGTGTTFSYSGNTQSGVLTVSDGTHTAKIAFNGDYLQKDFHLGKDSQGGTVVTYTPPGGDAQHSSETDSFVYQGGANVSSWWTDWFANFLQAELHGSEGQAFANGVADISAMDEHFAAMLHGSGAQHFNHPDIWL